LTTTTTTSKNKLLYIANDNLIFIDKIHFETFFLIRDHLNSSFKTKTKKKNVY